MQPLAAELERVIGCIIDKVGERELPRQSRSGEDLKLCNCVLCLGERCLLLSICPLQAMHIPIRVTGRSDGLEVRGGRPLDLWRSRSVEASTP